MFRHNKDRMYCFIILLASFLSVGFANASQIQDAAFDTQSQSVTNLYFSQTSDAVLTASSGEKTSTDAKQTKEQEKALLLQKVLLKIYRSNLLKKTYKHVVYPESSIQINEEGEVVLMVQVDRKGKVLDINYESKSPSRALNRAARNAVKQAKPYSKVPAALEGEQFEIQMPIRFRLTN